MRKVSAWWRIVAEPTKGVGVFGMNFDYMPELRWTYSRPLVLSGRGPTDAGRDHHAEDRVRTY